MNYPDPFLVDARVPRSVSDAWIARLELAAERDLWDKKYGLRDAVAADFDWRLPMNGRAAVDGDI